MGGKDHRPIAFEIARDILIETKQGLIEVPPQFSTTEIAVLIPPRIDNQLCDICWQIQSTAPNQPHQTTPIASGNEQDIERILDTHWQLNYSHRMQKCHRFLQELDPPHSPQLARQANFPPSITAQTSHYRIATLTPSHELKIEPLQDQLIIDIQWGTLSQDFPNSIIGPTEPNLPSDEKPNLQSRLRALSPKANFHTPFLPPFYTHQSFQTFAHDSDSLNHQIESLKEPHISISHLPKDGDPTTNTRITLTSNLTPLNPKPLHHRR